MNAYHAAVEALSTDAELCEKVLSANDPEERAEILRQAGVDVPTQEEIDAARTSLAGVNGGNTTYATAPASSVAAAAIAGSV